jgi:hypothetical protein
MVKSRIVVLTGKEKTDVAVCWMMQPTAGAMLGEREREIWRDMDVSEIQLSDHWNQTKTVMSITETASK